LLALAVAALLAAPAHAVVPRDGTGFALADDAYHGFPGGDEFEAAADGWFGEWFEPLRPRAFRFQVHWNADPVELDKARRLIDWVRARGVTEVAVTFKKNGATPDADAYARSVGPIVHELASRVDVWGAANEPNLGDTWLPGLDGADLLAAYWQRFAFVVTAEDPTALKLSPEFADRSDLQPLSASYMTRYIQKGGGFGDIAGWHGYWGAYHRSLSTTDDYLRYVPAGVPVWVTEVGGFGSNQHPESDIEDPEDVQNSKVRWLTDTLARHPRIDRIFYYHTRDSGQPDWDTALLRQNGSRRSSWFTWCVASHAGNFAHPDCTPAWFTPGWAPALEGPAVGLR
jgi:hypothetical protein